MAANTTWKNDWILFTHELEQQLSKGRDTHALMKIFGGAQVRWRGVVEEIDFDEFAHLVNIALPERIISIRNGEEIHLDGITLSVTNVEAPKWRRLEPGDEVTFEAKLGEPGSPFAAIEFKTLKSGKSIVMISANDAIPVV